MQKNKRFRELLNRPGIVSVPVAYDVMSARLMEQIGFDMFCMGGNGTMASTIGYPDVGIATQTEMIERARRMALRTNIPMYADADTGYGSLGSVRRTVREYEAAGVSGIHLEDQTNPKKCGAMEGVTVVDADEMADKISVAVKSRSDPNFVIIGRTDCYNTMGLEEVIRRLKLYADAGADVLMPENIYDTDEWRKITKAVTTAPILCDLIDKSNLRITDREVYEMGFKLVCRGMACIMGVAQYLKEFLTYLHKNGGLGEYADQLIDIREYEKMIGIDEENALAGQFINHKK